MTPPCGCPVDPALAGIVQVNSQAPKPDPARPTPTPSPDAVAMAMPGPANANKSSTINDVIAELKSFRGEMQRKQEGKTSGQAAAFFIALFTFMPINVGLLCILAAFIGGCSVNKEEIWQIESKIRILGRTSTTPEALELGRRLGYLTEHPGYSTVRGLVVYLVLVSGLLIAGSVPFQEEGDQVSALTQYLKLAGLFSFFGYLAGSDPTVFTSLLNIGRGKIPQP